MIGKSQVRKGSNVTSVKGSTLQRGKCCINVPVKRSELSCYPTDPCKDCNKVFSLFLKILV